MAVPWMLWWHSSLVLHPQLAAHKLSEAGCIQPTVLNSATVLLQDTLTAAEKRVKHLEAENVAHMNKLAEGWYKYKEIRAENDLLRTELQTLQTYPVRSAPSAHRGFSTGNLRSHQCSYVQLAAHTIYTRIDIGRASVLFRCSADILPPQLLSACALLPTCFPGSRPTHLNASDLPLL